MFIKKNISFMKHYLIGLILFISINTGVQAADNKGITLTVSVGICEIQTGM